MSVPWQIVLLKVFLGDETKFLRTADALRTREGPHRFTKNDQGASYGRYEVLQWWRRLKISFCEIFGVVQFPSFATLAQSRRAEGQPRHHDDHTTRTITTTATGQASGARPLEGPPRRVGRATGPPGKPRQRTGNHTTLVVGAACRNITWLI